jgi:hypothetical protein
MGRGAGEAAHIARPSDVTYPRVSVPPTAEPPKPDTRKSPIFPAEHRYGVRHPLQRGRSRRGTGQK